MNINTINKMIKYLLTSTGNNKNSFGTKRSRESQEEVDEWDSRNFKPKKDPRGAIKAVIENGVDYSQLNIGDEVIARFFPTSQRDLEYSSIRKGMLIYKDPEEPSRTILELENGEKVGLFDRTDVTGMYYYSKMNYSIDYKKLLKH